MYISENGCTSAGVCPYGVGAPRNYYWQPTAEVVLQPGAGASIIAHELCHAWQGDRLRGDDIALDGWADTPAGRDFPNVPYTWTIGSGLVEDGAWTCAAHYLGWPLDPTRQAWAERWLP